MIAMNVTKDALTDFTVHIRNCPRCGTRMRVDSVPTNMGRTLPCIAQCPICGTAYGCCGPKQAPDMNVVRNRFSLRRKMREAGRIPVDMLRYLRLYPSESVFGNTASELTGPVLALLEEGGDDE